MTTAMPKQCNISKCSKKMLYVSGVYSFVPFQAHSFIHHYYWQFSYVLGFIRYKKYKDKYATLLVLLRA